MISDELSLDHPPRGIRMERSLEGETIIKIRLFSLVAFPIFFMALFWNSLTYLFAVSVIAKTSEKFGWGWNISPSFFEVNKDTGSLWFLWVVLVPFVAIGIFLFFFALSRFFGRCEIRLGASEGSVRSSIGSVGKTQRFVFRSVKSIAVRKVVDDGDEKTPIRMIITMNNGREIKFPYLIKVHETWLAFALNKLFNRKIE